MTTTPPAKLEGPIPITEESGPFHGTNAQPIPGPGLPPLPLAEAGYVEEEYFVSGEAEGVSYRTSVARSKARRSRGVQWCRARRDDPRRRGGPPLCPAHRARHGGSRLRDGGLAEGRPRRAREAVESHPLRVARHFGSFGDNCRARDDRRRDRREHGGTHARSRTHGSDLERDPEPGGSAAEERSSRRDPSAT